MNVLSGTEFCLELRKISGKKSLLNHQGYVMVLKKLTEYMESRKITSSIEYSEFGLLITFNKDGEVTSNDFQIKDIYAMSVNIFDFLLLKYELV